LEVSLTSTVLIKNDKTLRRYATIVERALASWETSPEEWADYIAFLSRLLKAIQAHGKELSALPYSSDVASKLAQCLNPALPSGVHQKALEVYAYIFATFGREFVSNHLHAFLPGISGVLSFASLSTRPGLYDLLETYVVQLKPVDLRPIMKSLVLSILPALEDETSEDFERAMTIMSRLETMLKPHQEDSNLSQESAGFFWQCIFLAVVTSPSRRQGALHYFIRRLPNFGEAKELRKENAISGTGLSFSAEAALTPESGLLIRSFVCGLSDPQPLIQRGFLDLLVTNLPLSSPVLQERVSKPDFDRLTTAAVSVLLRRDMSLNRRVWSWLLGPEPKDTGNATSSTEDRDPVMLSQGDDSQQFRHFAKFGQASVERCLLEMLELQDVRPAEKARPFRICLSLMDRWEIGGFLVPRLFLPAMRSIHAYSKTASREDSFEAIKSASLFFDGTESRLIWTELFTRIRDVTEGTQGSSDDLLFFRWVVQHFNVREEEMITLHIPLVCCYMLDCMKGPSGMISDRLLEISDCATLLMDIIPARAFVPLPNHAEASSDDSTPVMEMRILAKRFYANQNAAGEIALPSPMRLVATLLQTVFAGLNEHLLSQPEVFARIVQAAVSLLTKLPYGHALPISNLTRKLCSNIESLEDHVLQFSTISSTIIVLSAISVHLSETDPARHDLLLSGINLLRQLWPYLSPTNAKHHVEAVRLVWQLDDLVKPEEAVRAGLNGMMHKTSRGASLDDPGRMESIWRFTTLWLHTLPSHPIGGKSDNKGLSRRGSAMITSTVESWPRRQEILSGPLLLSLDALCDSPASTRSVARSLLANPSSMSVIFQILITKMTALLTEGTQSDTPHIETRQRALKQRSRELEYVLGHVLTVLTLDDEIMWQGLVEMDQSSIPSLNTVDVVTWLASRTLNLVGDHASSPATNEHAISVLRLLLRGPYLVKIRLQSLALDDLLLGKLRSSLALSEHALQTSLLDLTVMAMSLRHLQPDDPSMNITRSKIPSGSGSRKSSVMPREEQHVLQDNDLHRPPSQLLDTLREGLAAPSSRPQLDAWLDFLAASIPFFGDSLLTYLIPLVDTFCDQLRHSFENLTAMSDRASDSQAFSPDNTILKLLEGLNLLLAEAHERASEDDTEPQRKASEVSQSVLGAMASSAFKSQATAPPSRSAKANSRLTVILAFQDAIRMCVTIWLWSTSGQENESGDRYNAATTSYYTQRLRNKTRSMLEQLFAAEPLESLEVVMTLWSQGHNERQSSAVLSLLHVLTISRPKSVVPAILDALCSRTQANHMSPSHQSSLTSDLSATDVVAFFTSYLESVDDDATDEIWPDCTAFMRDVLSNPLPFRQILPALLWVTSILAEKLDNTNFGDQRKMRRELGDQFSRLLSATFAASPVSSYLESNGNSSSDARETGFASGRRSMDVVVILKHVVTKLESILDSVDRITTVINIISTSLISPAFHAKSFPSTITPDLLSLLARMTRKAPTAKSWRREVLDAFNNPHILDSSVALTEHYWLPVLQQWSQGDKERVNDLLSRLAPPSSAGIMFGVGAAAARLKADSETQFILRRLCLLLLASPTDSYAAHMQLVEEKLVELFQASTSSSPSSTIKAELFMLCRALILSTSAVNVAPLWPIINDQLQNALSCLATRDQRSPGFANLSLLQAGKLLDLLVALAPDEFQLYEWLYITDTTDAVYRPSGWSPTALADQLAEHLGLEASEDTLPTSPSAAQGVQSGQTRMPFGANVGYDNADIRAMAAEDFAKSIMRPFLSQLSINAYESTYGMERPLSELYGRSLLEDLLDSSTLVDYER
jgi:hypothetical protein